ncbi:MAG: glycosyltransferase family 9 protein [Acidobacteriota bacterium]
MKILIVRLGALGDIVHAVPAAAALRRAFPDAQIDWLVDARHRTIVELVTVVDRVIVLERATIGGWADVARRMRQVRYDVAIDFQGLLKSAVLARASGARRVLGFSIWHLREKTARPFYSQTDDGSRRVPLQPDQDTGSVRDIGGVRLPPDHVIDKNLRLLRLLGVDDERVTFPLAHVESSALEQLGTDSGGRGPFALINPGAAWPNKRWPAQRYGEIAAFLRDVGGLPSVILWGPGEEALARTVADASDGAARIAPPTAIVDLLALSRAASLMVSGDTGPLHLATAAGTPTVSLFGPTDPSRNGPWSPDDVTVSVFGACGCQYERRCRRQEWCLGKLPVSEVTAAIQQRLTARRGVPLEPDRGGESRRQGDRHQ